MPLDGDIKMEHIHGVDVSWMTHGNPKDKAAKSAAAARQRSWSQTSRDTAPQTSLPTSTPATQITSKGESTETPTPASPAPSSPKAIPVRPGLVRSSSTEDKKGTPPGTSPSRKGSWFSNISSKFSSSSANGNNPPPAPSTPPVTPEFPVPKPNPSKNAVLQHATKHEGEGPYTPAPPRSSQSGGILHVFRRLSTSNGSLGPGPKINSHGLVERRVLNVDRQRERCEITGLNQAKLRRVAFCVDVEIAPMPKYTDRDGPKKATEKRIDKDNADKDKVDQTLKQAVEKGEGEALKRAKSPESLKEDDSNAMAKAVAGQVAEPKEAPKTETAPNATTKVEAKDSSTSQEADKNNDRKKEKKKKSEEERKARKEKKRKQAEANGTIPMELHLDSDDSESGSPGATASEAPKVQLAPTTNPVRIYRRCCQLRETPILKKITEQLTSQSSCSTDPGVVDKLDLTGYWMQLADLVTLGDYLAVVPVKELILENCGLTDEGLRVILAGLLAVSKPDTKTRRSNSHALVQQGGRVERLVLKNNKIGPEGWKHICLFIFLCRTLKNFDLSTISFPKPATDKDAKEQLDMASLLGRSLATRLGGSTLSLLNLGEAGLNTEQLSKIMDGVIKCGVTRLGLAHNGIDAQGMQYVAKFLKCGGEALDLAGNNLREQIPTLVDGLDDNHPMWALSLAECNLDPPSLCKLFPRLVKLKSFRFIDLSHNPDLFNAEPSAVKILRRYLPVMTELKRIHLTDCAINPSQAIAIVEILPETPSLAHISLMENPKIMALTNASTEESQEEAVALFASLLAATRVSTTLVAVDIEVPSERSGDLVKAMARQVIAYCLRNMERVPLNDLAVAAMTQTEEAAKSAAKTEPEYPQVLQHLVGHDVMEPLGMDTDVDAAPDDDYVIGGTGVVKALTACLENRGDDSRRQSGDFHFESEEGGIPIPEQKHTAGKAKETSKHLLLSARKIRHRLQPALSKARKASAQNTHAYNRLLFLDNTLKGIIKRFEDEFPDTRETSEGADHSPSGMTLGSSVSSTEAELYPVLTNSDDGYPEDENEIALSIKSPSISRSNSIISTSSKALADEEGSILRAGHKFRSGIFKTEHWLLLSGLQMVAADPRHLRLLHEMLDEIGNEELSRQAEEKGVVAVFEQHREELLQSMKEVDPEHWERFRESQEMAVANLSLQNGERKMPAVTAVLPTDELKEDSNAVVD